MDTVINTKTRQGGTEFRVLKQKDADVSEELHYFAVKEIADSIVLARSAALAEVQTDKKTSSRYPWASVEEVVKVIEGLGGETNDTMLEYEIANLYNVDKAIVRQQLKNDALSWLRPTKGKWAIPKREFDL